MTWFHFFTNLLIPIIMVIAGGLLFIFPPKKINNFIGYRTSRSMKNIESWIFAQKYSGLIMLIVGTIMLIITIIIQTPYYKADDNTITTLGMVIIFIQLIVLIGSTIPTEIILKKKFNN